MGTVKLSAKKYDRLERLILNKWYSGAYKSVAGMGRSLIKQMKNDEQRQYLRQYLDVLKGVEAKKQ